MFMKKDMIFFSPDGEGLTSTSANHIANMAKEMIRNLDSTIANLVFYTTEVSLIGVDSRNVLQQGATDADVLSVAGKLRIIAQAKSLISHKSPRETHNRSRVSHTGRVCQGERHHT